MERQIRMLKGVAVAAFAVGVGVGIFIGRKLK